MRLRPCAGHANEILETAPGGSGAFVFMALIIRRMKEYFPVLWNKNGSLKFSATIIGLGCLAVLFTIIAKALPERFIAATGIDRGGLVFMEVGTVIILF